MKKIIFLIANCLLIVVGMCQSSIDVTEVTIKIGTNETEKLYFGFAAGDKIVFNFEEVDGKEVKEVEIKEYPDNTRFKEYESKKVKDKTLDVNKEGIYMFRFYNSAALKGRVCRVKIQRIPKSEATLDFDTAIEWVEKFDTTYQVKTEDVIIGYDTIYEEKSRKVLASIDTNIVTLADRVERVHSSTNLNSSNSSSINIQLPDNTFEPNIFAPMKKTEVVSWAYSIAVGDKGKAWYQDGQKKAAAKSATKIATSAGLISTGYGVLALLAIEGVSAFSNPPDGDNVKFYLQTSVNGQIQTLDSGNSVAASGRITDYKQGGYTLTLENDNIYNAINVDVKVIAVTVTENYKKETYKEPKIVAVKEKQTKKIAKVEMNKIPVMRKN